MEGNDGCVDLGMGFRGRLILLILIDRKKLY